MAPFKYHLTYNGKFSKDTYIEYFDPEKIDTGGTEKNDSSDNRCTEALKTLKNALGQIPDNKKDYEQIVSKLCGMLSDEPCKPNCDPCKTQKENENLYFAEEYKMAIHIIKEIIHDWQCNAQNIDLCERMKCQWDNLPKNNRILFHGQRGSGKTSVTMSVAKSIEGHLVGCSKFKVLPIINPGYFDQDTNILKTVISNMFEMAKCIIKSENDIQQSAYEELLKQFEEVYRLLGSIETPNKEKHTLESLNEISKASGMREAMQKLINQFIKILPCKANYLVLVIDDVDMSVAYAATMLEQIKKFLELDNLLILISANLDQLYNEMREHYSKAFKETLKDKNQSLSIDVEDLASKYLLKLFPTSRRINVERPVSELLQTKLSIPNKEGNLQKVVLSLIWEKTRLLFIPKDAQTTLHPIVPTNLRELAQLMELLVDMDNVEWNSDEGNLFEGVKDYDSCKKNLNGFKRYFLNVWVPTHLNVEEEQVFRNIPSDITEINKHLINSINAIGTKNKKRLMSREVGLDMIERNADNVDIDRDIYTMVSPNDPRFVKANKISDIYNQPSNYSYGDLLLMIDKYETYFESEEDRRFSNAIKIYYSILLFETMFFKSNKVRYDRKKFEDDKLRGKAVIPIQKLIGGTVYYPNYFEIITSKYFMQKGPSFDAKRAFYHKLPVKDNDKKNVGIEYPLFSVLYYGDVRPDRYEPTHIYDTTYKNNADVDGCKYVTFDILSILNNMLNPWHTLERLGLDINIIGKFFSEQESDIWKTKCTIGSNVIPNSILPFYSVDIMLQYLKNHISYEDFIGTDGSIEYENDEKKIKSARKSLLSKSHIAKCESSVLYNCGEKTMKINGLTVSSDIYNYYHEIINNIRCYYEQLVKDDKEATSNDITLWKFKNRCIALVVAHYSGSEKDKITLLKGIKRFNSIPETYKYLVDKLWENEAIEYLIRNKIQKKVRESKSVSKYYEELLKLTEQLCDSEQSKVYRNIFELAEEIFINPEPGNYYLKKGDDYFEKRTFDKAIKLYNMVLGKTEETNIYNQKAREGLLTAEREKEAGNKDNQK